MKTVKEAAEILKLPIRQVQRLCESGKLKAEKVLSKRFYYMIEESELSKLRKDGDAK